MLWIVVTSPVFLSDEATFLHRLLANGVDIIHLRKPGASAADCARLLEELSAEDRSHIVVHDFFELAEPYGLRGIHLNARRNIVPEGYSGHVSRSCHSLEEVKQHKDNCNYVFLSPIFDSVSKQGYASAFTDATLRQASEQGILDNKVVALGGVTPDKHLCCFADKSHGYRLLRVVMAFVFLSFLCCWQKFLRHFLCCIYSRFL